MSLLGVGMNMDVNLRNIKQEMELKWPHFGRGKAFENSQAAYEMLQDDNFAQEAKNMNKRDISSPQ